MSDKGHLNIVIPKLRVPGCRGGFWGVVFGGPRFGGFCMDVFDLNKEVVVTRSNCEATWKKLITALHKKWKSGALSLERRQEVLGIALLRASLSPT